MVKKKLIYLILIFLIGSLLLVGCSNNESIVGIRMADPQSNNEEGLTFEDENISIRFMPYADGSGLKGIAFEIQNLTNKVLKIKWNETSLVKPNGVATKLIHSGVTYSNRDRELSDTTIPVGAKIQDHVVPTEKIYYSSGTGWFSSAGWSISPIIKTKDIEKQNVSLLMPIEIETKTIYYQFKFEVYIAK